MADAYSQQFDEMMILVREVARRTELRDPCMVSDGGGCLGYSATMYIQVIFQYWHGLGGYEKNLYESL